MGWWSYERSEPDEALLSLDDRSFCEIPRLWGNKLVVGYACTMVVRVDLSCTGHLVLYLRSSLGGTGLHRELRCITKHGVSDVHSRRLSSLLFSWKRLCRKPVLTGG